MNLPLRVTLLAATLLHPLAGLSQPTSASTYPDPAKVIRLVVPAPPGGPGDVVARALARELTSSFKTLIVVDNKPGGASIPGALVVARAPADGYTLLLTLNTTLTQVPHLYAKAPFDPFAEFTPIAQVYRGSSVLVAHPDFPAKNLAESIALSRTQPVAFASPSAGTTGHLYIEMLNADYGAKFIHVPYKGASPAEQDLLAGHVQLLFDSPATAVPYVRAGRLKALAAAGTSRLAGLPNLLTAKEQGFAGFESSSWLGVFGPAGLPPQIVAKLNQEISVAVNASQLREQFSALGVELVSTSPEAFRDVILEDYNHWGKLIKRINLKLD